MEKIHTTSEHWLGTGDARKDRWNLAARHPAKEDMRS